MPCVSQLVLELFLKSAQFLVGFADPIGQDLPSSSKDLVGELVVDLSILERYFAGRSCYRTGGMARVHSV